LLLFLAFLVKTWAAEFFMGF